MICTIINYCTNDYRFLGRCISEAARFSSSILVPVCDHFFDGTPENRALLTHTYSAHPECHFLEFAWDVKRLYTPFLPLPEDEAARICLWHSTARYVGCFFVPQEAEYVLFLDADEIAEGERLARWLETQEYKKFEALWFLSHRYRFRATERLREKQYAALLVRKSSLVHNLVLNAKERFGHLLSISGAHWLKGEEGTPFFHHYSWVRPREECLQKVRTWGKRANFDWKEALGKAWRENSFLEEQPFDVVEPFFDPLAVKVPCDEASQNKEMRVTKVNEKMLFKQELLSWI